MCRGILAVYSVHHVVVHFQPLLFSPGVNAWRWQPFSRFDAMVQTSINSAASPPRLRRSSARSAATTNAVPTSTSTSTSTRTAAVAKTKATATERARRTTATTRQRKATVQSAPAAETEDGSYELEDDFTKETERIQTKMNIHELDRLPLVTTEKSARDSGSDLDMMEEGDSKLLNGHGVTNRRESARDTSTNGGAAVSHAPAATETEGLKGIWSEDFASFVLLLLLYCLQGVPLGWCRCGLFSSATDPDP